MKKHLLFISAFALAFASQAQLINPGFETWTNDLAVPTAMNPNGGNGITGWNDYNFFNYSAVGSSPISVFRCDTAHGGSYSARIRTTIYTPTSYNIYKTWGIPFIGHNYLDTLGIIFNGNVNETTTTFKPGIPFTQNIASLSFYYQYTPQAGDTADFRALLVHQRNAVGGGKFWTTTATGSTWQQGTINFTYVSALTPDTLYILFSSSSLDRHPKPGSLLLVDDVSVVLASGVNDIQMANDITISPNPSGGSFQLSGDKIQMKTVDVFNIYGEKVYSSAPNSYKEKINLDQPSGIYFVRMQTDAGTLSRKVMIAK